jgi:hypothetical protein
VGGARRVRRRSTSKSNPYGGFEDPTRPPEAPLSLLNTSEQLVSLTSSQRESALG